MNASTSNNNLLAGKVVMIQGAGRWPGPLLARALAAQGATVAACDLSPILLNPLESDTPGPGIIRAYVGDTSRGMPARSIVDEIFTDFGRVDVLINNPRVIPHTRLIDMDEYDWQHTIDLNLNGPFLLTRLIARQMTDIGEGVIINLVAGPAQEVPGQAAYAASQAGLLALSRTAAQELMGYNIRVYAVCLEDSPAPAHKDQDAAQFEPRPLAELVIAMCSGKPAPLTGNVFRVTTPAAPTV